jgi:hypothetical protein
LQPYHPAVLKGPGFSAGGQFIFWLPYAAAKAEGKIGSKNLFATAANVRYALNLRRL